MNEKITQFKIVIKPKPRIIIKPKLPFTAKDELLLDYLIDAALEQLVKPVEKTDKPV